MTRSAVWTIAARTSGADGSVLRINPRTLRVVSRTTVPGTPNQIIEAFGAIWVSTVHGRSPDGSLDRGHVVEIRPTTGRVVATYRVGPWPAMAANSHAIWVADTLYDGSDNTPPWRNLIIRISPRSGATNRISLLAPAGIAATNAAIWVSNSEHTLYALQPNTGQILQRSRQTQPSQTIQATGGSAWTLTPNAGYTTSTLQQFTLGRAPTRTDLPEGNVSASGLIAVGHTLWAVGNGNRVLELTTDGQTRRTITLPRSGPTAIGSPLLLAADGSRIYALTPAGGLFRLDGPTPKALATITRPLYHDDLVVRGNSAWVTASSKRGGAHLARITLSNQPR